MASGRPDYQGGYITTSKFIAETNIACTAAASVHTLQGETKAIEIYNDGDSTVFVEVNAAATVNSRPMRSRTSRAMDVDADSVGLICGAGNTASVWITELG